jgi:hypothetical protein
VLEKATQFEFGGIRPLACQKMPVTSICCSIAAAILLQESRKWSRPPSDIEIICIISTSYKTTQSLRDFPDAAAKPAT